MVAGFHVPAMVGEFVELVGSAGGVEFRQSGPIAVNVGLICEVTVMVIFAVVAHCPAFGVKI